FAVARDPVCGMNVNPQTAKHKTDHAGMSYYFCSASCAEKFKSNPGAYLRPAKPDVVHKIPASSPATAATAYVCPMCPEVRESTPVPCPSCGMALEPETPISSTKTEYTCPMHPEIVRQQPGICPICGMALESRTVTVEQDNPELRGMTRRFWVSVALTLPLLGIAMADMLPGMPVQ